jgi:single-strand DNA-binding protein
MRQHRTDTTNNNKIKEEQLSNVLSFTGSLGRDGSLKTVNNQSLVSFTVANSIGFGDKKTTLWFDCTLWGKRAETIAQYLVKGQSVFVSGELTTREYQAKDGSGTKTALALNVTVLDLIGKKSDVPQSYQPAPAQSYQPPQQAYQQQPPNTPPPEGAPYDDDIPF